jgi:hypothetical protein
MSNGTGEKKSSCGKYLAIGCGVLVVLGLIGAVGLYFGLKGIMGMAIEATTDAEPRELPQVPMTEREIEAVLSRANEFTQAVENGQPTEPLVLSSNEINALIQNHPDFENLADMVYVTIADDAIQGEVSIPADRFIPMEVAEGRYLNGSASFTVSLSSGRLMVFLESLQIGDTQVPSDVMTEIRRKNLAENAMDNPEIKPLIQKLDTIEVKDGNLIITPKKP